MKKYSLNEITTMQFFFLIISAQIGIGVLSLPKDIAKTAGTDGWISLLIGWFFATLSNIIIVLVMKRHPDATLYDLLPMYFGKIVGTVLQVIIILYFFFFFTTIFYATVILVQMELLPNTPFFFLSLLFNFAVYAVGRNHLRVLGRYAELLFWGHLWMLFVYYIPLKDAKWIQLLPIVKYGWQPIFEGTKTTLLSFIGFETIFFTYPFLMHKKNAIVSVIASNAFTLLVYMTVVIVCFVYFSPYDIVTYEYPTLRVIKTFEFRFLERFEIIFIIGYITVLMTICSILLYIATFCSSQLLGRKDHRWHLRAFLCLFLLSLLWFTPSSEVVDLMKEWISIAGGFFAFVFPLVFLIYSILFDRIKKRKQLKNAH